LKTAAAVNTRTPKNSEAPRLGRPRAEGKTFALLYILVAFIFMSLSVFISRIKPGTLYDIFGLVTAYAEARLFLLRPGSAILALWHRKGFGFSEF
jgi:hypothetical protein